MKNQAPCIAVFGTGSDVGKSIVATALCRIFADKGIAVAPFKAQNMSNNSGVTPEGLEMGRAQIVQAEAAGLSPHVDMNPVLLKPTSDVGSQVVLLGKVFANSSAREYHETKERLFSTACGALDRLRGQYGRIVMEGAGSCAEVNLMAGDIVNFRMAEYAGAPVVLVADIHKGGVFAQIVGTLECLSKKHRDLIAGFVVNRFRGDIALFQDGVRWIEQKTGKPVFGVLPWYNHFAIEAEDSVVIESPKKAFPDGNTPAIAVIRLPHISNFTDFAPLSEVEGIDLFFIEQPQNLSAFAAVILPGSKNTRFDLAWIKETGWAGKLAEYADAGGNVLGICGGYQLMGESVHDPEGFEGPPGTTSGLSLLPVETVMKAPKTTTLSRFSKENAESAGYEIHMGSTVRLTGAPLFAVIERNGVPCNAEDGCVAGGGKLMGTYMHGLFDNPEMIRFWLESAGIFNAKIPAERGLAARKREYGLLAEHFRKHINTELIEKYISHKFDGGQA